MMQSIIANSRTAEQQNSRTAEQQNSRTAEQQNSRIVSDTASFFENFYMADSKKNTFLTCIYACRKSVLFRYGGIRGTDRARAVIKARPEQRRDSIPYEEHHDNR